MTVSRRRDVLGLAAFVVMCFGVSVLGGRATAPALAIWYPALAKPAWTPPSWVFGPVWTLLYPIAGGGGLARLARGPLARRARSCSCSSSRSTRPGPGSSSATGASTWRFACVVLLWLAILATIRAFWPVSRGAAILLVPYLAWVGFATALTAAIWVLNAGGGGSRLP